MAQQPVLLFQKGCFPLHCGIIHSGISSENHITQMIERAFPCETAAVFGRFILLLDRYSTSALRKQAELNAAYGSPDYVTIVTKAKSNYVAYRKLASRAPGTKGRPCLKGVTVKLSDLLNDDSQYRKVQALLYRGNARRSYISMRIFLGIQNCIRRCILYSSNMTG